MKMLIRLLILILSGPVYAADFAPIKLTEKQIKLENLENERGAFTKVIVEGQELNRNVGEPQLPVKSYLLSGKPEDITVDLKTSILTTKKDVLPWPAQEQDCRCETKKEKVFQYNVSSYEETPSYRLSYLGAFRGQPITRLDVSLAKYKGPSRELSFFSEVKVSTNTKIFKFGARKYSNYLILTTPELAEAVNNFASWKRSRSFSVSVETISQDKNSTSAISAMVQRAYEAKTADFVMIIGDQNTVATHFVETSSSYRTPSDLPYYLMDGQDDKVPDMFFSRIVADRPEVAVMQLDKIIEFEQKAQKDTSGMSRVIGIASNEGSNPSDNEYVLDIEQTLNAALGTSSTHFFQNDSQSNPLALNAEFEKGAFWLTYMGHGDGSSWPSMNDTYHMNDIDNAANQLVVKPVVIDVACQNGGILANHLGSRFLTPNASSAFGAVAYYGGSVDISWHPPAVMAKGIAYEHADNRYEYLGEALLAGQLYLAGHWNDEGDVFDNMKWYHLQGDPGMRINQ